MYVSNKVYPVTPCMDIYKENIQYGGSIYNLKLRISVRGDLQNKEMIESNWDPTALMRTMKYFLVYSAKHNSRVQQLYLIRAFQQAKIKHRVFVKLDSRYREYFPEYVNYFGRTLRLDK